MSHDVRYCHVDALEKTKGYTSLKPEQENAMYTEFVMGHDVFVCLPTCLGKSL